MMPSAKPVIDTPAETLGEANNKTHYHALCDVKIEVITHTLGEVKERKEVDTWADRIARVEIRTVDGS